MNGIDKQMQRIMAYTSDIQELMTLIPDLTNYDESTKHQTLTEYVASLASVLINQRVGDVHELQSDDFIQALKIAIRNGRTNEHHTANGYESILSEYEYKNAVIIGSLWLEIAVIQDDLDYIKLRTKQA